MFKDPIMERLRHEGLNNLHDDMERQSDGITTSHEQRGVTGLVVFLSMEVKWRIASLLREIPTLWHELSNWMNEHLNSMIEIPDEELSKEEPNLEDNTSMVLINKLYQTSKAMIQTYSFLYLIYRKVEAIVDGGARVSIIRKQCW